MEAQDGNHLFNGDQEIFLTEMMESLGLREKRIVINIYSGQNAISLPELTFTIDNDVDIRRLLIPSGPYLRN